MFASLRALGLLLGLVLMLGFLPSGGYAQTPSGATRINPATTVRGTGSIVGTLSKGSGTFVIDHPLDPRNKLLYHSFVESPDVKNMYDGIATLDGSGEVTIELPSYFLALNKDFRYLATPLGAPAPNLYLKREVRKRILGIFGAPAFTLAGGSPGQNISWQVTGIRHDPFIEANPIEVEVEKGPDALVEKGVYFIPEAYE